MKTRKKDPKALECFKGIYPNTLWHHGNNPICHGGVWQPQCEHLKKCIQQFEKVRVPQKELNRLIKKYVKNKDAK